jgi:N-acetyl sugar amidotransferase
MRTTKDKKNQICSRCVMDTTDPEIVFDDNGVCNHCHTYDQSIARGLFSGDEGRRKLDEIVHKIKEAGRNKEYDCVIGVSGGVDSSFVAYKVKELGLRPLAVHLDNGWDSELAVKNIEQIINRLKIPLYTHVIDWEEFKDLQLAFLKASTPDSEIPSDHAILALMIMMAKKYKVPVITGMNVRTESHLPSSWSQGHIDWRYIKNVHKRFGKVELKTFPYLNIWTFLLYLRTDNWVHLLNYIDYRKEDAKKFLIDALCWKDYGWKHHESIYTRFYQGYILPKKFGFDKRKTHLSSLICASEITRGKALEELKNEPYPIAMQNDDKVYAIKKFNLTAKEFEDIMNQPQKSYHDYPNYHFILNNPLYNLLRLLYRWSRTTSPTAN